MAIFIRLATGEDIPHLAEIERAAGQMFLGVGMPEIADDDPLPEDDLIVGMRAGYLWVAVEDAALGIPVAYLLAKPLRASVHIEQLTVHPDWARRRIGARLVDACAELAREEGMTILTLTTFRDVPWNAPYYRRIGFAEIAPDSLPDEVGAIMQREHLAGLDRWPRIAMAKDLGVDAR